MPLYDYSCQNCSYEFETLQGANETPLIECPECKKTGLKKLAAAPAFAFKGGGWYKDLYSSSSSKPSSESTSKPSSGPDSSSSKKPSATKAASKAS